MEFSSVQFMASFAIRMYKSKKIQVFKANGEKPKGWHLTSKEWAPSVELSQQNIIRIIYGT